MLRNAALLDNYFESIIDPPLSEWEKSLFPVVTEKPFFGDLAPRRAELKKALVAEALRYTTELKELGSISGIELPGPVIEGGDGIPNAVLMMGHQPVICHPGVFAKYLVLSEVAKSKGVLGINVIIDTDVESGGRFAYPMKGDTELNVDYVSVAGGDGVLLSQRFLSKSAMTERFGAVNRSLAESGLSEAGDNFSRAARLYHGLHDRSVTDGNTLVRRHLQSLAQGPLHYLDIPLSRILQLSPVQRFLSALLFDAKGVRHSYNTALLKHRRERKIENLANPFPDLTLSVEQGHEVIEAPFWMIDLKSGARSALFIIYENETRHIVSNGEKIGIAMEGAFNLTKEGVLIAPKAATTTLLLRLLCCDFFIHGRGGAKYDAVTDLIIEEYFKISSPKFAVVSGTQYLFLSQVRAIERARDLKASERDMQYHPEKYLEDRAFSKESRLVLAGLIERKRKVALGISQGKGRGESVAALTKEIGEINTAVKQLFTAELTKQPAFACSENEEKAYTARGYPFFFFV